MEVRGQLYALAAFVPEEISTRAYWIQGSVGPLADLQFPEKIKIFTLWLE
jgi:hypothetical protein